MFYRLNKPKINYSKGNTNKMKKLNFFSQLTATALFVGLSSVAAFAQTATTSGTVTFNGSVSTYVDLTSGGAASLQGNKTGTGGINTDGVLGQPINVDADLGELGPSNTNQFVKLTVPIRIRSNDPYQVSMEAVVLSNNGARGITSSDIGFGVDAKTRTGTGVNLAGADVEVAMDPTAAAGGPNPDGRYVFTDSANSLANYSTATEILSGDYVLNPVPTSNTSALIADTIFAVKPAFFQGGSNTAVTITFTAVTQP